MKEKQKPVNEKDEYTGATIKQNDSANLDHTVSFKEIFENQEKNTQMDHTVPAAEIIRD